MRAALARRYPGYRGLAPGFGPPTRHHFRYFEATYGLRPDVFETFHDDFNVQSCTLAHAMGMFDPNVGTTTHPAVQNLLTGDGTVVKPRYKAKLGDRHLNTETGELEQRRYDRDAADYTTWDPDSGKNITIRGIKFALIFSHLPGVSNQRMILDELHVPTGDGGEAARAVDSITTLVEHLGAGAQGVCWDMAIRGKHKDQIYDLALIPIVKTAHAPGGGPKSAQLGMHAFRLSDGTAEQHVVFTQAGAPLIEVIVGGDRVPVFLIRRRTRRVGQRTSGYRWYNDYAVPDQPPVPQHLHGATASIRLNHSTEHAANHNRAENISATAQNDPDWDRLYASRPVAESVNSLIKRPWYHNRAPRVGAARNHFSLLCGAIWLNYKALIEYQQHAKDHDAPEPNAAPPTSTPTTPPTGASDPIANAPPTSESRRRAA
jgi:hypothetical protein